MIRQMLADKSASLGGHSYDSSGLDPDRAVISALCLPTIKIL